MNISLEWLNSYLDRPVDADEADRVLTALGFPIEDTQPGDNDTLLDVEVTSNRPDMLSHLGVARDIAAATGRTLSAPAFEVAESAEAGTTTELTSVANDADDLCPLYTARVIRNVKIGPSPEWLARRIEAIGLRPINNAVDVTNYVLHELGQPLHAFDLNKLAGKRIVVRRAAENEPITVIDGSTHKLTPQMLVIADAEKPVAVAGVMGGAETEVTESTTDILLESARFEPLSVRHTSRTLKLASDSSYRFERGVDRHGVERASRRAAALIAELAAGSVAEGVITAGETPPAPHTVEMRPERCNQLLGIELTTKRMAELLDALGLAPETRDGRIVCTVPSHRLDLHREVDLIEEVARLHGYDHIPVREKMEIVARPPQQRVEGRKEIGRVLTAHGYHETITFSFLPPDAAKAFAADWDLVKVDEEKKRAEPALRPSLLPSLLSCRKANQDAGNTGLGLFEVAEVFGQKNNRYAEEARLALLADAERPETALRAMRGSIEELLEHMGLAERIRIAEADPPPAWARAAARLLDTADNDRPIGAYGVAADSVLKQFDLQTPVVLAELDYEPIITSYPPEPEVRPQPRFPAIERDLSIIVSEDVRWSAIESSIRAAEPPLLEGVRFVETYRGKPVPKGQKSVTLRMTFRDPERTLQHDEVTEQVDTVVKKLGTDVAAKLRAG